MGWIPTGEYLRSMYGIGSTCGVDAALVQEVSRHSGISKHRAKIAGLHDIKMLPTNNKGLDDTFMLKA